jgi:hypothetical protein
MNGIVMFRREGHSPANLLSFVFGIVIGVGELATTIRNQRKIKNSISRVKA